MIIIAYIIVFLVSCASAEDNLPMTFNSADWVIDDEDLLIAGPIDYEYADGILYILDVRSRELASVDISSGSYDVYTYDEHGPCGTTQPVGFVLGDGGNVHSTLECNPARIIRSVGDKCWSSEVRLKDKDTAMISGSGLDPLESGFILSGAFMRAVPGGQIDNRFIAKCDTSGVLGAIICESEIERSRVAYTFIEGDNYFPRSPLMLSHGGRLYYFPSRDEAVVNVCDLLTMGAEQHEIDVPVYARSKEEVESMTDEMIQAMSRYVTMEKIEFGRLWDVALGIFRVGLEKLCVLYIDHSREGVYGMLIVDLDCNKLAERYFELGGELSGGSPLFVCSEGLLFLQSDDSLSYQWVDYNDW